MAIDLAQASARRVVYKAETTYGTLAGTSDGQILRRTQTSLNLTKEAFESQEKRVDFQVADARHGLRRVGGALSGELSGGTWAPLLAAALRKDFAGVTTVSASSGDGFTLVASTGVLTRAAGGAQSFITDGIKVGMVVRPAAFDAAVNDRNFLVTAVSATALTLVIIDGGAAMADVSTPDTNATLAIPGKLSYIPLTGHTSKGFTIEDYFLDLDRSRVFSGCRAGGFNYSSNPNAMSTIEVPMMGLDMTTYSAGSAPYFSSPTAAGTARILAADGYMRLANGTLLACTGVQITLDNGLEAPAVRGANVSPNVFYGRAARVTGQVTAYLENFTLLDAFDDETEVELFIYSPSPSGNDFVSFFLPRVKINTGDLDDPETGVVQTLSFMALLKGTTSGYESTTLQVQDSLAP